MLHTDKQTNKQTDKRRQKHIPPGGGQQAYTIQMIDLPLHASYLYMLSLGL